jgi:hypothetical protein
MNSDDQLPAVAVAHVVIHTDRMTRSGEFVRATHDRFTSFGYAYVTPTHQPSING